MLILTIQYHENQRVLSEKKVLKTSYILFILILVQNLNYFSIKHKIHKIYHKPRNALEDKTFVLRVSLSVITPETNSMFSILEKEKHTSVPTQPVEFQHLHHCLRTVLPVMFECHSRQDFILSWIACVLRFIHSWDIIDYDKTCSFVKIIVYTKKKTLCFMAEVKLVQSEITNSVFLSAACWKFVGHSFRLWLLD